MGRIEDIISQLNTIAENPAKAIEDYKKQQERVLSVLCRFIYRKKSSTQPVIFLSA